MGTITLDKQPKIEADLIKSARKRTALFPQNWIKLHYSAEVDSLFVQISDEKIRNSRHDLKQDVIYNLNAQGETVSLEILDLKAFTNNLDYK